MEGSVKPPRAQVPVRRLSAADIEAVLAIQGPCREASQWSRDGYARAAAGEFPAWVATIDACVAGFLVIRAAADEVEILNLAVEAPSRRQGVASQLLAAAVEASRAAGAKRAFLEVRESNAGAIAFYQRHAFALAGRRPRYYSNPPEDALVLRRSLEQDSPG